MANNVFLNGAKIFIEIIMDIIYFPLWWYSKGFLGLLSFVKNLIIDKNKSLAFSIWLKNIFRPMYGQYDLAGIFISLLVRIFQIIIRGLVILFWIIISLLIVLLWIILPFFVFNMIIFQLS